MTCNINSRERILRIVLGFILFFLGTIMFVTNYPGYTTGWRVFQLFFTLLGFFIMLEGTMGWCAIKALLARRGK